MTMFHWIDWVLLLIIVVSSLISLKRGFFKEAFSLVIIVVSVILSLMFHEQLAVMFGPYIDSPS
jgi:membrane protein required for colicin V production